MSPLSLVAIAFALALVAMSFAFSGGAVLVAIPVALLVIGGVVIMDISRRRKQSQRPQDFRVQAQAKKTDFTERDQETLVSE